ncbi:MAG: RtcB family protein, partial [Candidatus Aenigmarchaeota archaeon]|nr:RtcB family protein [Candidatus Aenigmarchaeota archaeon]
NVEDGAMQQARDLANLPFTFKWVALMPDCHQGYGMPIGGVLATTDVIIPNAVGVDIGCGMCAIKTSLTNIDTDALKSILGQIRSVIPVGFSHHKEKQTWTGFDDAPDIPIIQNQLEKAKYQLGTLGGGNHFLEIQSDTEGFIWIMIHSGSRNFGLKIATEYHRKAKEMCTKWHSDIPTNDLSFLPYDSHDGIEYIDAMRFAMEFAKENRFYMLHEIKAIFKANFYNIIFDEIINIHHNYASIEKHFGKHVIVHRKGATSAKHGETGIIPGSQGSKSYIVTGKGNRESFMSCSHGAGRKMGRKQAINELDFEQEKAFLESQNILHSIRNKKDLDEACGAYKDINTVINNQLDLIDIMVELSPLAVIKG